MSTTHEKTFDCVEMKHQAQQKLRAEFESRKNEFSSYFAFFEARTKESSWPKDLLEKVADFHFPAK